MKPFRLLVFDWDGTLMDSEARIVSCMQAAFADLALPTPDRDAVRDVIGLGLREAVERLRPGAPEPLHQRLVSRYRYHFLEADPTPSSLFVGAAATLETLYQQGFLLAIATGKGRVGLDKVLRETALAGVFHATRCADETQSKPHPRMLFELMAELDATPEETLMIGDTEYDLAMAANAGTAALAVSYGVHPLERLRAHCPLDCLDSIAALPSWLGVASRTRGVAGA